MTRSTTLLTTVVLSFIISASMMGCAPSGRDRAVLDQFANVPLLQDSDIGIEDRMGKIVLTGQVASNEARLAAQQVAEQTDGVRSVENLLSVNSNRTGKGGKVIADAVLAQFKANPEIGRYRASVRASSAGVVVIEGEASTAEIAESLSLIAKSTPGVTRVESKVQVR